MKVVNHFGPPLAVLKADVHILEVLNSYADHIVANKSVRDSLDYTNTLSGAVYGGFGVKLGFFKEVEDFLIQSSENYIDEFNPQICEKYKLEIFQMWIISQIENSGSYLHYHTGDLAGILYLKVPEEPATGISMDDPRSFYPGGISFVQGHSGLFHKSEITLNPSVGELYIFPANLMHRAYPFFGKEERRSFSFNIRLIERN